jgi:hypothetical protein
MALTATFAKLNNTEFADTVRAQASAFIETAQAKLDVAQTEGRTLLANRVMISAQHANTFSEYLAELATKIAPAPKARRAPAARKVAAKKVAAKRPAARKAKA